VSFWHEGKETPITKVTNGRAYDAKGQAWGMTPLAMKNKNSQEKHGIEFKGNNASQPLRQSQTKQTTKPKAVPVGPPAAPAVPGRPKNPSGKGSLPGRIAGAVGRGLNRLKERVENDDRTPYRKALTEAEAVEAAVDEAFNQVMAELA
jgi:hypothetical protein